MIEQCTASESQESAMRSALHEVDVPLTGDTPGRSDETCTGSSSAPRPNDSEGWAVWTTTGGRRR